MSESTSMVESTARTLDEGAKRRPSFLGGRPVVLADGQEWYFPRPRVRFTADDGDAGCRVCFTLDDGYPALMEALFNATDMMAIIRAQIAIGRHLLLVNYDLTTAEIGSILQFAYDREEDPEGYEIKQAVMAIVMGQGEKRAEDGGE